jgi:site-specific DNA-methyltransferase (adenine-specific)
MTDKIKIHLGDCMDLLTTLPDKSVDVLYTDAPYIPPEHSKTLTKYKKTIGEMGILEGFYKCFLLSIDRVLKDDGLALLYCNSDSYSMFYIHLYPYVKKMRCFVWDKIMCSLGYTFRHQHELILYGERPNMKCIKCGTGDIFKFKAVKANEKTHPAEKPIDLHKHVLQNIVNENSVVLDTFMGTGSIGMACKELGCNYIGMEIEPSYFDVAKKKLF